MANVVVAGAPVHCTLGASPATLAPPAPHKLVSGALVANLKDVNLVPPVGTFGTCAAPAKATPAGTPGPCTPNPVPRLWSPGGPPKLKIGGEYVLTDACRLQCSFGGMITVDQAGQVKLTVP